MSEHEVGLERRLEIANERIASLEKEVEKYKNLSEVDVRTGLINVRGFIGLLDEEIRRSRRNKKPFSLLMLDLNNLKWVNDNKGHLEGDKFLEAFVALLKSQVREVDSVARIGGDEFAVILEDDNQEQAALTIARLEEGFWNGRGSIPFFKGVAIGSATFANELNTAEKLMKAADEDMYAYKKQMKQNSRWKSA